jgi:oligopeptidase B
VDELGSEKQMLYIKCISSNELIGQPIDNCFSFQWSPCSQYVSCSSFATTVASVPYPSSIHQPSDASTQIFWVLRDQHARPVKLFRRPFGGSADDDVLVYEESDPQFYLDICPVSSDQFIIIVASDHETSELHLLSAAAITDAPQLVHPRTT